MKKSLFVLLALVSTTSFASEINVSEVESYFSNKGLIIQEIELSNTVMGATREWIRDTSNNTLGVIFGKESEIQLKKVSFKYELISSECVVAKVGDAPVTISDCKWVNP